MTLMNQHLRSLLRYAPGCPRYPAGPTTADQIIAISSVTTKFCDISNLAIHPNTPPERFG